MRGPNVTLAPLRDEDSASLFEWINDRELVLLNAPFRPVSEADHARWFEEVRKRADVAIFGIRLNDDDRLIGSCQLLGLDAMHGVADLRIRIGAADARGRGLGTETVRLLVQHAFGDLGLRRVQLHAFHDNTPALRCYEKVGFVREGLLREGALIAGKPKDLVVMGILAGEVR